MRKGDVAISHIVTLFLALITIAAIIYLIYYYLKNNPVDCEKCKSDLASWCAQCYGLYGGVDWGGGNPMSNKLEECAVKCVLLPPGYSISSGCNDIAKLFCKPYIPF